MNSVNFWNVAFFSFKTWMLKDAFEPVCFPWIDAFLGDDVLPIYPSSQDWPPSAGTAPVPNAGATRKGDGQPWWTAEFLHCPHDCSARLHRIGKHLRDQTSLDVRRKEAQWQVGDRTREPDAIVDDFCHVTTTIYLWVESTVAISVG